MALPDKLHKRSELDYVLYDEADNRITQNGYDHWYNGKKYKLIWEHKYDPREVPNVYLNPDDPVEYIRITDEDLVKAIADHFWNEVSRPLQVDGPFFFYQSGNTGIDKNSMGMMALGMAMANTMNRQQEGSGGDNWICPGCNTNNSGKFCMECGLKRP